MKARSLLVVILIAATTLPGCEFGRRFVNKPWGKGTYIPALVCAAVGAGVGVGIQEGRSANSPGKACGQGTCTTGSYDDWKGAAIGAPVGAILCGLAGHYLFDPETITPTPTPAPLPTPTPTVEPLPPPSSKRIILRGVHFDFDKSDIRLDSRPVLDEAAEVLRDNPRVRIAVEGHTDSAGSDLYNEKLSVRRAEAVFRYLVNHGVTPERMEVIGYGKTRPVTDNESESGRAQNRRVELHVVNSAEGSK
jgi:outer membrane protein OmpA-like peptidoglycan-associated protein